MSWRLCTRGQFRLCLRLLVQLLSRFSFAPLCFLLLSTPTGLRQLSHLALDQTRVSDRGLAAFLLSAPPTLTHLSLNQTGITEGTLHLLPHSAPHLWVLSVKQTGVSGP